MFKRSFLKNNFYLSVSSFCTDSSTSIIPRINFLGIQYDTIEKQFDKLGFKHTVAKRVWNYVYHRGVTCFSQIPDSEIGKKPKEILNDCYFIHHGTICKEKLSENDGTAKWLLEFGSHKVESVYIPSDICRENIDFPARRKAGTICVSSQVGCTVGCPFCYTGTQKVARNLKPSEILGQVHTVLRQLDQFKIDKTIQSIVFMGQGEPFYNYLNVVKAIRILSDQNGLCFSKKRITVSTSGVVPMIKRFSEDPELETVQLAISLHAVKDSIRNKIVPLNIQWPLKELMQSCREYHQKRRILFEYIMLKDINDSEQDALDLLELLKGIKSIVNLIPFNSWPGSPFECSEKSKIMKFHSILQKAGKDAPIRWPRGTDILAACGQLQTSENILKQNNMILEKQ